MKIKLSDIIPDPDQPRKEFDQGGIEALAESIRQYGLLNPIAVAPLPSTGSGSAQQWVIVDGERRWRACQLIEGMEEIDANPVPAERSLMRSVLANLQRADLNPIEEAHAYQDLRQIGYTLEEISMAVGRSISHLCNRLALLEVDEEIQEIFKRGELSAHSHVLKGLAMLPAGIRLIYAQKFAQRKTSIPYILKTCRRVAARDIQEHATKTSRHFETATIPKRRFDIFQSFHIEPPIELTRAVLAKSATRACQTCVLFDEAGPRTCQECPLVIFLMKIGRTA